METEQNLIQNQPEGLRLRADIPQIQLILESPEDDSEDSLWVDFDFGEDHENGIKGAGFNSYVISPITEQNLFSDKYLNCTGTIGIGRDKISGKEISFLSHQDPEFFVNKGQEETDNFKNSLKSTLDELVSRSEDGTIEVVLFGGNIDIDDPTSKKSSDYIKSIEILNEIIHDTIGCDPVVLEGPNHSLGAIDVRVFTKERKVLIGK